MEVTHLQPQPQIDEKVEDQKKKKKQRWDFTLKVLIGVALVILLIVGILLPIKLVPDAVSTLAGNLKSIFSGSPYKVMLDTNSIESGQSVRLSWNGVSPADTGTYYLSYQCVDGLQMIEQFPNGTAQSIPCASAFPFTTSTTASSTIELVATSDQIHSAKTELQLSFLKTGATKGQSLGSATLTVTNDAITTDTTTNPAATASTSTSANNSGTSASNSNSNSNSTSTATNTTTNTSGSGTTNNNNGSSSNNSGSSYSTGSSNYGSGTSGSSGSYSGTSGAPATVHTKADLAVTLVATGIIDPTTGAFVPTQQIQTTNQIAIRFRVSNNGGTATGPWNFSATLPTIDPSKAHYTSPQEPSLGPGSGIYFTLSFGGVIPGQSQIVITADPNGSVSETNKANNRLVINAYMASSQNQIQVTNSNPNTIYTYPAY
jgi:hypothetical protein